MAINLMYITNQPQIAQIAEKAGVDRIFVDMEYIEKSKRQGGMDTVQSHHTVEDVRAIRSVLTSSELLVRINPIHDCSESYASSEDEINAVIEAGADIVMLPFFKTIDEVNRFGRIVNHRCKTMLLVETPEAAENINEILDADVADEIYIGLNDLSLGYGKQFMFELLADGTVEELCLTIKKHGIPYGFGGIAAIGTGTLPAETILKEHYRLGSTRVILSRSFCNCAIINDEIRIKQIFDTGIKTMRAFEKEIAIHSIYFEQNTEALKKCVKSILENKVS